MIVTNNIARLCNADMRHKNPVLQKMGEHVTLEEIEQLLFSDIINQLQELNDYERSYYN